MTTTIVVDDESDIRLLVRLVLEAAGDWVVIAEAADGDEAVALLRAQVPSPDVLLIDNRMPTVSGLDAAREILDRNPDQRIVLFSACIDDQVRSEASDIGIRAVVDKTDIHRLPEVLAEVAR